MCRTRASHQQLLQKVDPDLQPVVPLPRLRTDVVQSRGQLRNLTLESHDPLLDSSAMRLRLSNRRVGREQTSIVNVRIGRRRFLWTLKGNSASL